MEDWSYDEHYAHEGALGGSKERRYEARRRFVYDVAANVILPNVQGLVAAGAEWIQIDEPAATTKPDEVPLVVEGFNEATKGVEAKKSMHICFSDYSALWPAVLELDDCLELQLEFANRDSRELGTSDEARPGYAETLRLFKEHGYPNVGLGVLDIHSDFVEPAELVRDRILYAVEVLGDPERIQVNPDCGLRTRSWDVVYEKLANMVQGTRLAEEAFNRGRHPPRLSHEAARASQSSKAWRTSSPASVKIPWVGGHGDDLRARSRGPEVVAWARARSSSYSGGCVAATRRTGIPVSSTRGSCGGTPGSMFEPAMAAATISIGASSTSSAAPAPGARPPSGPRNREPGRTRVVLGHADTRRRGARAP